MSIHVAMRHVTRYRYDRPVALSPHQIRLRPAPHCRAAILSYSQRIEPAKHFLNWQQDPYSNYVARATFPEKTSELRVDVDLLVEIAVYNPFDFFLEPQAETFPFAYEPPLLRDLQPFLQLDPITPGIGSYLATVARGPARTVDMLVDLNRRISREIRYVIRAEAGVQTCDETLSLRSGSCRDSAWLLVQLLRRLGIAARFASGYLIQLAPDPGPEPRSGPTQDFVDLHAWCEAYLPGAGWVGFDPTSGLLAGEGHIPLACTPEPSTAAPIAGTVDESDVEFSHEMSVVRIHESPRVTRPYTDAQWSAIEKAAASVDRDLARLDARLTMGGEPTFVSREDTDAPEWNTAALGGSKRARAADLLRRLQVRLAPGALLHFGQGKWYPGEQLPRWALGCFWRADGEPVWRNPARYADEDDPDGARPEDARRFLCLLARRLGVPGEFIQPGFEDVWYYLWRERRLPVNVDPFDARLDDELERERLRRVFSRGLDTPVGYALPLDGGDTEGWLSGPWFLRDERMYLLPGDSPMGYRLPLDSLPWVAEGDVPLTVETDPFAAHDSFPPRAEIAIRRQEPSASSGAGATSGPPARGDS
ncbi:MAG TPA: transglutaminase family protein, partial [Vicinamibacterales bacterium]